MNQPTQHRLAFSTLGCPDLSWQEILQLAMSHKFAGIELRCIATKILHPSNFSELLPPSEVLALQLRTANIAIPMLGTSVVMLKPRLGDWDELAGFAKLADLIGCPYLRIFDGGQSGKTPSAAQLSAAHEFITRWEDLRYQHGWNVQIAVETHDALTTLEATQTTLASLPYFRILWDTHHTWKLGKTSLTAFHKVVCDRIVHLHLKDSISRPSPRKPFTYVAPGSGEFPWGELHELLPKIPQNRFLSFEWERHWHPQLAPLPQVLTQFSNLFGAA